MANIIIIENDNRIAQEMVSFFKELDEEHQVRVFETPTAFEKRYFSSEDDKGLASNPLLLTTPSTYIPWFLDQRYTLKAPFTDPEIKITLDTKTNEVLSGPKDTEEIFGSPFSEYKNQKVLFDSVIADNFRKLWLNFFQNAVENGRGAGLFPIKTPESNYWLISVRAHVDNDVFSLYIKDESLHLAPIIASENEKRKKEEVNDEKTKLLGIIHLIIFKAPLVDGEIKEWIEKTQKLLKDGRFWPIGNQPRVIATKYEEDGMDKMSLVHPFIDDLICLPLDRLLFLQKVEIVLNLPGVVRPRYLFNQQVNFKIEISKRARIEKISDIGFAIRNPIGLQDGLTAHFYIQLPDNEPLDVHAKVIKSKKHPENPNQYLVYFSFLYLSKEYISIIRKFLASDPHYRPILDEDFTRFKFNPDNIFLSKEEKRIKTIAIIDADDKSLKSIFNTFRSQTNQIKIIPESSFYLFAKKYIDTEVATTTKKRVVPATSDDIFADNIGWIINPDTLSIEKFLTSPKDSDLILGHNAIMLFFQPTGWLDLFKDKDNKEVMQESILIASSGQKIQKVFELSHQDTSLKLVSVTISKANSKDNLIRIEIAVPTEEDLRHDVSNDVIDSLDMILVDQSLIPDDVETWVNSLIDNVRAAGLSKDRDVKIICVGQVETRSKLHALRYSKVSAILPKPVDSRFLLAHVSMAIQCPFTIYNFDNLGWSNRYLHTYIAKPAELIEIAEYGAAIRHARPIMPGTTLFLHGSIFEQAEGKSLCARFYHCDKDDKQKGSYICHLTYYGINESFLKYTRSWIRENYVNRKTGTQSS